jgi:hypothetical protein
MSEAKSPCVWLETADHELAQFIGDVADKKRHLTQEAKAEKIRQTVQGARLVLRDCEVTVAKPRNDYTAKVLAASDVDSTTTRTPRRECKLVAKNAHGAIVCWPSSEALKHLLYVLPSSFEGQKEGRIWDYQTGAAAAAVCCCYCCAPPRGGRRRGVYRTTRRQHTGIQGLLLLPSTAATATAAAVPRRGGRRRGVCGTLCGTTSYQTGAAAAAVCCCYCCAPSTAEGAEGFGFWFTRRCDPAIN